MSGTEYDAEWVVTGSSGTAYTATCPYCAGSSFINHAHSSGKVIWCCYCNRRCLFYAPDDFL